MTGSPNKKPDSDEIHTYTEFSVKKNSAARTVFTIALISLFLCSAVVCAFVFAGWVIGAVCILLSAVCLYFILPRTKTEYRYTISDGSWRFEKICSSKHTDTVLEIKLDEIVSVGPYSKGKDGAYQKIYDFRGSGSDEKVYSADFKRDGKLYLILFRCTEKALGILSAGCSDIKG